MTDEKLRLYREGFAFDSERDCVAARDLLTYIADLLRENAELTASNARAREALGACKRVVPYFGSTSGKLAYELAAKVLAESPAESLVAIQDAARVEERERCLTILRKRLEEALIYSTAKAIRHIIYNIEEPCGNQGNGGKAQSI